MYTPPHFAASEPARLLALCAAHDFALLLCAEAPGVLEASHLPFLVGDDPARPQLLTHVARGNRLAALAAAGQPMTAVFQGPHAYVSPRWYQQPSRQVPTWNYAVVHAHATPRVLSDDELRGLVRALARRHEAAAADPWTLEQLDPKLAEGLLGGIVGIGLEVTRLEGKAKLSQNRSDEDLAGVMAGLHARGGPGDLALAALMGAAPAPDAPREWRRETLVCSTDRERIDLDAVMRFMAQSYWAADENAVRMARAIRHSLAFGVYEDDGSRGGAGRMVAFARVITDLATFGYLSDVFVDPAVRGRGVGKWLVDVIYGHPALQDFRRHMLMTRDAHSLYERVGFTSLTEPAIAMEKIPPHR